MAGFKSPAQNKFLNKQHSSLAQRFAQRYGDDMMQATRKKGTPKRKGFLSKLAKEGYRG